MEEESQLEEGNFAVEDIVLSESPRVSWRLFGLSNVGSLRRG